MEQIAIYPYNDSYSSVVRHQKLMNNMRVKSLVSPKGWGFNGNRIKTSDGELIVSDDFISEIESCSVVWFVDDAAIPLPKSLLRARLLDALKQNKKILFTRNSGTDEEDIKKNIPPGKEIVIETKRYDCSNLGNSCFSINTPVIFVLGLTENTDKYEVQVALREQFIRKGYRISSVSSRRDSDILGMHPLPAFLFDDCTSETEKILMYNHLIKQIEQNENPDVIIIGIPGGAFPFSKNRHNHFGITAFEIANAVTCDCAVFCSPYLNYSLDLSFFSRISDEIAGKMGFSVDYYHIAARTYDYLFALPSDNDFSWVTLDEAFIESKIKSYNRNNVFNLLNHTQTEALAERIIENLAQSPKVQSV